MGLLKLSKRIISGKQPSMYTHINNQFHHMKNEILSPNPRNAMASYMAISANSSQILWCKKQS